MTRFFDLGDQLLVGGLKAIVGRGAPVTAGQIQLGTQRLLPAGRAAAVRVIPEKLDGIAAMGAWRLEDVVHGPVLGILSRAFAFSHNASFLSLALQNTEDLFRCTVT